MTKEEIAKRFCKFELCTHRNGEGMCCLYNQDNCIFHRLEKENAELKEQVNILDNCDRLGDVITEAYKDQLIQAKEIIKKLLKTPQTIYKRDEDGEVCPFENTEYTAIVQQAEQFLKEIEKGDRKMTDRTSIDHCFDKDNPVLLNDDFVTHVLSAQHYALARLEGEFIKKDSGKLKWSLMPFEELKDVVRVLMHGAEKYSPDNWKKCDDTTRYKDALMRHVIAYVSGEKTDEEFGLSHLAHAVCNCLFLMWFDKNKKEEK